MKREHCDCQQGRCPCTCGGRLEPQPLSSGEWWTLAICMVGVFLLLIAAVVRK